MGIERLARIIPVLLTLGCAVNRPPVTRQEKVFSPPSHVMTIPPTRTVTHYPALGDAVNSAWEKYHPAVFAVGELHPIDHSTLPSTSFHFAAEALPIFAKKGCQLVSELLLSGEVIKKEIEDFRRTGRLGPNLSERFNGVRDFCGIMSFLQQVRITGMPLVGSHVFGSAREIPNMDKWDQALINTEITEENIISLLNQGSNCVISYGGTWHNDIVPKTGNEKHSYGHHLWPLVGYLEFDIYLPELMRQIIESLSPEEIASFDIPDDWAKLVPDQGVNLIQFPSGRMLAILPYSKQPVVPLDPAIPPNCPSIR
ncbi:MAG: hypothetical protein PHG97_06705 [Candidatus Margulisbacteria bacterium]|nr:hypothetical protein [Candidatus Margulisiibacteriota bacterium]